MNKIFRDSFQPSNLYSEGVKRGRLGTYHIRYIPGNIEKAGEAIRDVGLTLKDYAIQKKPFTHKATRS